MAIASKSSDRCLALTIGSWEPFVIVTNYTPPYAITGPLVDIVNMVMDRLGYCYNLVRAKDNDWGFELPNGSFTGTLGMLNRSEADMSSAIYIESLSRAKAVDFSEVVYMGEQSISYMRPKLEPDVSGIIKPYTSTMWIGIFLSLIVVLPITILVQKTHIAITSSADNDERTKKPENGKPFLWTICCLIYQSVPWTPRADSTRIVGGIWLLNAFILSTVYQSSLMARLIAPKIQIPFDSFEELGRTKHKIFTPIAGVMWYELNAADDDHPLSCCKENFVFKKSVEKGIIGFFAKKWGLTSTREALAYGLHKDFSMSGLCNFYIMKEGILATSSLSFAFPKKSPLKAEIDPLLLNLKEFGITNYVLRRIMPNATECLKPIGKSQGNTKRALTLEDLYGAFLVFLGGMILSILSFLFERFSERRLQQEHTM